MKEDFVWREGTYMREEEMNGRMEISLRKDVIDPENLHLVKGIFRTVEEETFIPTMCIVFTTGEIWKLEWEAWEDVIAFEGKFEWAISDHVTILKEDKKDGS